MAATLLTGVAAADHCGGVGRPVCSVDCETGHGLYPSPTPTLGLPALGVRCVGAPRSGSTEALGEEVGGFWAMATVAAGLAVMLLGASLWTTLPRR